MIIDTTSTDQSGRRGWRQHGTPFTGERMLKLMDGPYMINGKPRRIDMGFIHRRPAIQAIRDGNRMGREGIRDYMAYIAELCRIPDASSANFNIQSRWGPENGAASSNSMSRNRLSRC